MDSSNFKKEKSNFFILILNWPGLTRAFSCSIGNLSLSNPKINADTSIMCQQLSSCSLGDEVFMTASQPIAQPSLPRGIYHKALAACDAFQYAF